MKAKKNIQNYQVWFKYLKKHPLQYSIILFCIVCGIVPSFLLVLLIPYGIKQLQGTPEMVTWLELLGEHASRWVRPLVRNTEFAVGIPLDVQVGWAALILVAVGFLAASFRFAQEYLLEDMGEKIAVDIRKKIFSKFVSLPFHKARELEPGFLATTVGGDTREIRQTFTHICGSFPTEGLTSLILIAWLILLDTQLFILFVSVLIPAAFIIQVTRKTLRRLGKQGINIQSELLTTLIEKMRGWQSIRVHNAVEHELKNFDVTNSSLYNVWRRATRAKSLVTPLVEWLGMVAGAFIIVVALRRIAEDALSSGVLTGFLVAVGILSNSLQSVTRQLAASEKSTSALLRIENFLALPFNEEKLLPPTTTETSSERVTSVILDKVAMTLPQQKEVLFDNLNIELAAGSLCVIVGPSGLGKSTLIRGILGLEELARGTVHINRKPISNELLLALSPQIAFIPQDPFIFEGSVFENVIYPTRIADPQDPDFKKAQNSLKKANLVKDIHSSVSGLSGGEKQRLMFARAFYRDSSLWIIDEGTSALDLENERHLLDTLKAELADKIVIVVAHRPMVQSYATQIIDLQTFKA